MIKKYFLLFLLLSALNANIKNISYDWAGQNGIVICDGSLLWNRSWYSGLLFFDGNYSSYPIRYGKHTSKRIKLNSGSNMPDFYDLPDSSHILSYFDHSRGDYNYSKLDIGLNYQAPNKFWKLQGFKRDFYGNTGHYIDQESLGSPIHQSFRIDHGQKIGQQQFEFSIGRYITNSGLPDNDAIGKEKDHILSSAFKYKSNYKNYNTELYFSQFFQNRRINHSSYSDSSFHKINRSKMKLKIYKNKYEGFGIDNNYFQFSDNRIEAPIQWLNVYFYKNFGSLAIFGGYQLSNLLNNTFWNIKYNYKKNGIFFNIESMNSLEPIHPGLLNNESKGSFLNWNVNKSSFGIEKKKIKFSISALYSSLNKKINKIPIQLLLFDIQLLVNKNIALYGNLISQIDTSYYALGGGDIVNFGIKGNSMLFKDKMKINIHFYAKTLSGIIPNYGFNPFYNSPLIHSNEDWSIKDFWLLNFEGSVKISEVLLYYKINNIMNVIDSDNEDYLININYMYPKLGRMIQFGVRWYFHN